MRGWPAWSVRAKGPPIVAGVYAPGWDAPVTDYRRLTDTVSSLTVAFSENMSVTGGTIGANSITNPANWSLIQDGVSIIGQVSGITFGANSSTSRYEATLTLTGALADHHSYALTPAANLRDVAGNTLDGDYNGTPSGA